PNGLTLYGGILCWFSRDVSANRLSSTATSASRSRRSRASGFGWASRHHPTCGSTVRRFLAASRSSRSPSWWPWPTKNDETITGGAAGPRGTPLSTTEEVRHELGSSSRTVEAGDRQAALQMGQAHRRRLDARRR